MPAFWRCERIPHTFYLREARGHATIRDFPLATTTVGWVPDRTPAGPKRSGGLEAQRRVVRAGCRLRMQLRGNNIGLVTLIMNFVRRVLDPMRIVCSPDRIDGFSADSCRSHCRIFHLWSNERLELDIKVSACDEIATAKCEFKKLKKPRNF